MVGKEDIYKWFKKEDLASSHKIELMCNLLKLCLPMELRFIGSCLEAQVQANCYREEVHSVRLLEPKANEPSEYVSLAGQAADLRNGVQQTLCVYVALLRSDNTACTRPLYDALNRLFEAVRLRTRSFTGLASGLPSVFSDDRHLHGGTILDGQTVGDLILLFTMASLHPAFDFEQHLGLAKLLSSLQLLLLNCNFVMEMQEEIAQKMCQENTIADVLCNGTNDVSCQTSFADCPDGLPHGVYVKDIEVRRVKSGYQLVVKWSDSSVSDVTTSFRQLKSFHHELVKLLVKMASDGRDVEVSQLVPRFPFETSPLSTQHHSVEAIQTSFRDLLHLPSKFVRSSQFIKCFRDWIDRPLVTARADLSPSPRRQAVSSQSMDSIVVSTKLPSDLPIRQSLAISAITCTGSITSQPRSPEPNRVISSSKSSPLLTAHRASSGSRSRHCSPANDCNNVVTWLKEIRLHKYTESLAQYGWDQLMQLKDDDLEKLGLTKGARSKFLTEINNRSKLEASFDCESLGNELAVRAMRGEPADTLAGASRSSSIASPVNVDSSCGSEYSTPPGSPDDYHNHLLGRRHCPKVQTVRPRPLAVDVDKANEVETQCWSATSCDSPCQTDTPTYPTPGFMFESLDVVCSTNMPTAHVPMFLQAADKSPVAVSRSPLPAVSESSSLTSTSFYGQPQYLTRYVTPFSYMPQSFYGYPSCDQPRPVDVMQRTSNADGTVHPMPLPSDAVLVRPRLPVVPNQAVNVHESVQSPSGPSVVLLSPPDQCAVYQLHASGVDTVASNDTRTVYGCGFYVPNVQSSSALTVGDDNVNITTVCCHNCGYPMPPYSLPPNIVYQPAWPSFIPLPPMPPIPNCYTVAANSMISRPPVLPPNAVGSTPAPPFRLPNAVAPELVYQSSYTLPPPMPPTHVSPSSPAFAGMPPVPGMGAIRVRPARPPLSCANCGIIGHSQLDCKEPTIDTAMGTRQFHLNLVPKSTECE